MGVPAFGGGSLVASGGGPTVITADRFSLGLATAIGALLPDLEKAIRVIERENGKTRLSRRLREHEEALKAAIVGEALK